MTHPINRWQAANQLAFLLKNAVWSDSPNAALLGYAAVSDLPMDDVIQFESLPFCLVRPGTGEPEPEHPELTRTLRFEVELAQVGMTDMEGGSALQGGNRTSAGTSDGRGLFELEELVRQALDSQDSSKGFQGVATITASGMPTPLNDGQYIALSKLQVEIYNAGRDRYYAPPTFLTASGAGGNVSLTWSNPPRRWDSLGGAAQQLAIYYVSGNTPPTYAQGGATLFMPTAGATSASVHTTAGTWSLSIFALYDETGNGLNERQSPATLVAQVAGITA